MDLYNQTMGESNESCTIPLTLLVKGECVVTAMLLNRENGKMCVGVCVGLSQCSVA